MPRPHRRTPVALLVVALALPGAARGETAPEAAPETARTLEAPRSLDWSTFAYEQPVPVTRLRLGLELLGAVSVAYVGYLIQSPPSSVPGVRNPTWIWEKLAFLPGTWVFDADDFGTNFAGHPSAGTVYYLIARGNRASVPESALWTLGASLLWELVEHKEPVSINDLIVTPGAGIAIGEAFTQLSAFFDRSGDDAFSKAMAWIFNPPKKLHDWIDGAIPDRDPRSLGWHEFRVLGGGGFLWQGSNGLTYPVACLGLATRIFHAPGYGAPGRDRFAFGDGNASRLGLGITFTGSAVVDFLFDVDTVLAGIYVRDVDGGAGSPEGFDLLAGITSGYEYGYHRWDLTTGVTNRIAMVRLPGLAIRPRFLAGDLVVSADLETALTFSGVQPFALMQPALFPVGTAFPPVLTANGYYYAIGLRFAPAVEIRYGPASAGGAFWLDLFSGLTEPNVIEVPGTMARLSDQRSLATAWARWRVQEPSLQFDLSFQWRSRSGTADAVSASEQERSLLGSVAVVF